MAPFLFQRRTLWWPTWTGWLSLLAVIALPILLWVFIGEAFLSRTVREPADVLVVEGWIGSAGTRVAKREFESGGYRYIVTSSGLSGENWNPRRWNYALEAEQQLLGSGIPRDRVMAAVPRDVETHRTFESAAAVWRTLQARAIQPRSITVFTRGAHARRSRLVFARIFGSSTPVGVISWMPTGAKTGAWWESSQRAGDMLKETVGYLFELILNSGRPSNSPREK